MKQPFLILSIFLTLTACNFSKRSANDEKQTDSITMTVYSDTSKKVDSKLKSDRLSFKNIAEVIHNKKSNAWVNLQDSGASCALHFYFDIRDTVCIEYSPECWLLFPFKISSSKIIPPRLMKTTSQFPFFRKRSRLLQSLEAHSTRVVKFTTLRSLSGTSGYGPVS